MTQKMFSLVAEDNYPVLYGALQLIALDNGAPCPKSFTVPFTPEECLSAEKALETLTPPDLETFAIGELEAYRAIRRRTKTLTRASEILTAYFHHVERDGDK